MSSFEPHRVEWSPEKVERFWNYYARHSDEEFFSEKHSRDLARRFVRAAEPSTMVDVGCGNGALIAELASRRIRCTGIDSSLDLIEQATQRVMGAEFRLGSATAIPLSEGAVDGATLIEVVEHLDDDALALALAEARRVLRPGGVLMLTTPNAEDLDLGTVQCPDCGGEFHTMQHVRSWTPTSLTDALAGAGFTRISVSGTRFVENAALPERLARLAVYRLRRQRPRLLAFGTAP